MRAQPSSAGCSQGTEWSSVTHGQGCLLTLSATEPHPPLIAHPTQVAEWEQPEQDDQTYLQIALQAGEATAVTETEGNPSSLHQMWHRTLPAFPRKCLLFRLCQFFFLPFHSLQTTYDLEGDAEMNPASRPCINLK